MITFIKGIFLYEIVSCIFVETNTYKMNLSKVTTSELSVYSNRLFSYYESIQDSYRSITEMPPNFQQVFAHEVKVFEEEMAVVGGAMQIIQDEIGVRMENKLELKLNVDGVFAGVTKINELRQKMFEQQKNEELVHKIGQKPNA